MRAAVYHGPDQPIRVERLADPQPGAGELLVEVARCGICGSDVSMTAGGPFDYPAGKCFGHEYAGTVVEVGGEVSGWKVGDRLACLPMAGCGRCEACREGRVLLCSGGGRSLSCGFAEYVAVPTTAAVRLPSSLSLADGALVEPMACGLRALRTAGMQGGERVLVLGAGAMALAVVWWARQLGAATIVVASRSAHRRELCQVFGADAVHSFEEDEPHALEQALGGAPHIVAECVGKAGMLNLALDHVRMGGVVISMGMCMQAESVLPIRATFKEARVVFPLAYTPQQFEEAARAFEAKGFHPQAMVGEVLPLEELGPAIERIRAGAKVAKIHIDPRMSA